ncbi:MAG TPA: flagellar biosynthesis protein FliQ [Alphaproteobacteria bacterium]|nr:flagellar biosynthesis protein FliQ [Alphaproteobacteria bacterium]
MDSADVLEIARESMIVTLKLGAPILVASLVVGLVISLFQALTQIQEATIAFVPKVLVIFVVFLLAMPFMLATLTTFTQQLAARIVGLH